LDLPPGAGGGILLEIEVIDWLELSCFADCSIDGFELWGMLMQSGSSLFIESWTDSSFLLSLTIWGEVDSFLLLNYSVVTSFGGEADFLIPIGGGGGPAVFFNVFLTGGIGIFLTIGIWISFATLLLAESCCSP